MTTLTAPNVHPDTANPEPEPLNLYRLGMLFVVKCSYWSCRASNDPDELDLTSDRITATGSRARHVVITRIPRMPGIPRILHKSTTRVMRIFARRTVA